MQYLISVIVPVYQGEKFIEKLIANIKDGSNEDLVEIVLLNDGSSDGSDAICKKLAENNKNVEYYCHENKGVSWTRNKGLKVAKGRYVWFVDVDDRVCNNAFSDICKVINEHDVDIILFGYITQLSRRKLNSFEVVPGENGDFDRKTIVSSEGVFWDLFDKNLIHNIGTKVYRRSFLLENNCFFVDSQSIYEDAMFCIAAIEKSRKIFITTSCYYMYVMGSSVTLSSGYRKNMVVGVDGVFEGLHKLMNDDEEICTRYLSNMKDCLDNEIRLSIFRYKKFKNMLIELKKKKEIVEAKKLLASKNKAYDEIWDGRHVLRTYMGSCINEIQRKVQATMIYNLLFDIGYYLYERTIKKLYKK